MQVKVLLNFTSMPCDYILISYIYCMETFCTKHCHGNLIISQVKL